MKVGRWKDMLCVADIPMSQTGRLFAYEVRFTPEQILELLKVSLNEFPMQREKIQELIVGGEV